MPLTIASQDLPWTAFWSVVLRSGLRVRQRSTASPNEAGLS